MSKIVRTLRMIHRLHCLIRRRATGGPESLAAKFGVSPAPVFRLLRMLQYEFGAPVAFDPQRQSYYYTEEFEFDLNAVIF